MAMCKKCKNIVPPSDIANGLCPECVTDIDVKIEDKEVMKKEKMVFVEEYKQRMKKSQVVSFILTLLLSPFGVFYSSIAGGIVMILVSLVLIGAAGVIGAVISILINIIIGSITTSLYNKRIKAKAEYDFNLMYA